MNPHAPSRRHSAARSRRSVQARVAELQATIRELRETQEELENSQQQYANLIDQSPVGYVTLTKSGVVQYANMSAVSLLGLKQLEILRRPFLLFVNQSDRLKYLSFLGRLRRGSVRESAELSLARRNEEPVPVELIGVRVPAFVSDVAPVRVALVNVSHRQRLQTMLAEVRQTLEARVEERTHELRKLNAELEQQIRERTQLAESLNEVNRTLRGLVDSSPLAIISLDQQARVSLWSRAAERMFGWTEREVLGQPIRYVPRNREQETQTIRKACLGGKTLSLDTQRLRKDGSVIDVQITQAPLRNQRGEITNLLVMSLDITARKRLERQVLDAGEQEQQRLGRDLHDGLGQQLTGIGFMCDTLQQRLAERGQLEAKSAEHISALVKQAILQTRDLARGLFPLDLMKENLIGIALQNLAATTQSLFRIRCRYGGEPSLQIPDRSQALNLYRIAQEAVHNAVRYSHGKAIDIRLTQDNGQVVLTVQDDGVGIDTDRMRKGGMGLQNMKYRANNIGGTLDFRPGPSGGTVVTCTVEAPDTKEGRASARPPGSGARRASRPLH